MVTLSDARIDELIAEDVPYIDLTSHILVCLVKPDFRF